MSKNNSPFKIINLKEDTGFLVLQVSALWNTCHEKALKKHYDISAMQYAMLASVHWLYLHSEKNEVTQTVLSRHTKIAPMTVSQMLKVLEKKGYLYRETCSTDVRAKCVFLTEAGMVLIDEAVGTIAEADDKFFSVLGKNVKTFNKMMNDLLDTND